MASQKRSTNPLLAPAVSGFSLSESFGAQAAVLVPSVSPGPPPLSTPTTGQNFTQFASTPGVSSSIGPPPSMHSPGLSPMGPPPQLKPPPAGVFLLPPQGGPLPSTTSPALSGLRMGPPPPLTASPITSGQGLGPPPPSAPFTGGSFSTVQASKRSPYVPPPGIKSSASTIFLPEASSPPSITPSGLNNSASIPNFFPLSMEQTNNSSFGDASRNPGVTNPTDKSYIGFGNNTLTGDNINMWSANQGERNPPGTSTYRGGVPPKGPTLYNPEVVMPSKVTQLCFHWFYKINVPQRPNPLYLGSQSPSQEVWKPFTMIDSVAIEEIFCLNQSTDELIPTDGGRYDVSIKERTKTTVYWKDENNDTMEIRRCSWFYKSNLDGRWIPFDEEMSYRLESEYYSAVETGRWNRRLENGNGEFVAMHSQNIIVYFPSSKSSLSGSLDDWGQVQPPTDPSLKPREVHRGLDGLPEIPDGESTDVDHLVFIVHGIGSVCDMKFRSISEVVDGFRELSEEMSQKHFQSAHLSERANRIEFLPVNWHRTLHGEDTGTDERLKPLTLRSIPKLRSFINDTLLDILFYTSPIYCQTIIETVVSEINRMYTLFMARNETFKGQVSIIGHSLGSLIVFDILSHQMSEGGFQSTPSAECETTETETTVIPTESQPNGAYPNSASLEQVFALLEISEYAENFTKEGIDMEALAMCNEDDLKEGGLPLGPRKKLLKYLEDRKSAQENKSLTGLEKFQKQSVESDVKFIFGPAGTGQPSVQYPRLAVNFSAFYALGSPLGMFLAVRGIDSLGTNFSFPTCPRFFNIFHPFDPIAYRVEGLIKPEYGLTLRPVTIPHHKGRKRMHLELKDTVTKLMATDIKQKLFDSVSATINAVYSIAVGNSYDASASKTVEQVVEQEMEEKAQESDQLDSQNPVSIDSKLNQGRRIDYALQEAPLESFNEYLFALASHLGYWESEDTCLMILKDIYAQLNIVSDDQFMAGGAFSAPPAPVPYLNTGSGRGPFVETTHTPILAPAPSAASSVYMPPTMVNPNEVTDMQAAPSVTPIPTFPPMAASIPPPGPALPATRIRPAYPQQVQMPTMASYSSPPAMGMDPTAPISSNEKPIAPPPMTGFVRK